MTGRTQTLISPVAIESRAARVQKVRSPGGIEAWLVEDYAIPLIAVNFAFHGGAAQDPAHKPGVGTMLAGLLDEGAGPYDSAAFHQALEDEAIDLSFSADRDALHGRMKTLSRNASRAFELLGYSVAEARLEPEAVERVRGQVAASLRREQNDPDQAAARLFRLHSYPEHPYGRPVRGDLAVLPTITRDDLVAMRTKTMARDNLVVAVVGAIDAETLGRELDRVFGPLPAKAELLPVPTVTISGVGERHVTTIDVPQSTIRFGRQGFMRGDADFDAGTVVNHCLGAGSFTSRLYKEVREKRGLCYSVYSQNSDLEHAAMFVGATSTKNERALEAIDTIRAEIDLMAKDGTGEEELEKAKMYLVGSYALRFDTSRKIAGHLVSLQLDGYGVERLDTRNERIAAVTVEDAARAAKRLLGDGSLLIAVAGKPVGL
ncbi:putative zinc protease-like protein y4wB [Beijerinckiaceae bacterium RH AL1]|nr:pitrilysin family protein [Beijerinckiaceae bacterium]VVB47120.1 putative zinc protease-like protein y4wB [Beijerinckiaceae bacterium RH CH11]VVB47203.1 putative zinc protease-like protein y4wB [Beijerinckiaceae bacterium RH AL8]VVC55725.1 putative zinc protease-like protein y4wB [Beijerinckiaceae bacterium RH AL1]